MDFTTNRKAFVEALALAAGVADRRNAIPILANVLLRAGGDLTVAGSCLSTTVVSQVPCTTKKAGAITLHAKNLHGVVKSLAGDEVRIVVTDRVAEIRAGKSRFTLPGISEADFPTLPDAPALRAVDTAALADALRRTAFCACPDETRTNIAGVLLRAGADGNLKAAASDGLRMIVVDRAAGMPACEALVPRQAAIGIAKLLEGSNSAQIGFGKFEIFVSSGSSVLSSRLLDATFPEFLGFIRPKSQTSVEVNRRDLEGALSRVALMVSGQHSAVALAVGDKLKIDTASSGGSAEDEIPCDTTGPALRIGANVKLLAELLGALNGDVIRFGFGNDLDTIEVRGADESAVALLMPVRLGVAGLERAA